jgi:hypothetical protein
MDIVITLTPVEQDAIIDAFIFRDAEDKGRRDWPRQLSDLREAREQIRRKLRMPMINLATLEE